MRETGNDLNIIEPQGLAVHSDPALGPLQCALFGKSPYRGVVSLGYPVTGMRNPLSQLAVVREQHETGTVAIKTPDGDQRPKGMRQEAERLRAEYASRTGAS